MKLTNGIIYLGINDKTVALFEGQYKTKKGMAYNSYLIIDEKIAVMDTVDEKYGDEWLENLQSALSGREPDYLVVQHMEPDHSSNIAAFLKAYPKAKIVANAKAFKMIEQFFADSYDDRRITVKDGDTLELGSHTLQFIFAPMVHWPEVMLSYESSEKVLFSADAFGKFGTIDADEPWEDEAARYYFGIVGKYGAQVQTLLKKAAALEIEKILPLHGPMLMGNLGYYINLYDKWSSYTPEKEGVFVAYTSIYSNTEKAALSLAEKLRLKGAPLVKTCDLARCDMHEAISDAFRFGKLVLASPTYNNSLFPFMNQFLDGLTERNFQNKTVGFIENGTWAPASAKLMKAKLEKSKNITLCQNDVTILSTLSAENSAQLDALADELCVEYKEKALSFDSKAFFKIGYGLYAVTCADGKKDNALIVNTVTQLTTQPNRVAVTINKANYSHYIVKKTGKLNVCCLSTSAPFELFKKLGFQSGRTEDKLKDIPFARSSNGLAVLLNNINSYMSLEVEQYVEFETHGMFICRVSESAVLNKEETMTYEYYHKNVKPKPQAKKGYVCKICGYVYDGDTLPEDFICPLCKHPASDFEKIV